MAVSTQFYYRVYWLVNFRHHRHAHKNVYGGLTSLCGLKFVIVELKVVTCGRDDFTADLIVES